MVLLDHMKFWCYILHFQLHLEHCLRSYLIAIFRVGFHLLVQSRFEDLKVVSILQAILLGKIIELLRYIAERLKYLLPFALLLRF